MIKYPEIRFKSSWLLIGAIRHDIAPAYEKHDELYKLDNEYISKVLDTYEKAWRPYEEKIIHGMCDILGLEFRQNVIDIYAAPFYHAFSDPMVIATKFDPDRAVEVIAHELLHRLLTDNTSVDWKHNFTKDRQELFGTEHSFGTLVHIPVHAVLRALFDDKLEEPKRTIRDIAETKNHQDYRLAWDYVQKNGYTKIIRQLRESYEKA